MNSHNKCSCLRGLGLSGGHRAFRLSVQAYIRPSVDQVKIFVQGGISRPVNGSKLIFHMRMYLSDQQEYTRAMTS